MTTNRRMESSVPKYDLLEIREKMAFLEEFETDQKRLNSTARGSLAFFSPRLDLDQCNSLVGIFLVFSSLCRSEVL